MPADKRHITRVVNFFRLGANNPNEEEALLAITRAREMMIRYAITEAEIQAKMKADEQTTGKKAFDIATYQAYMRKMRNLAKYDEHVGICVGHLTDTRCLIEHRHTLSGTYTLLKFLGDIADVAVASELFMILLKSVRERANLVYGHGKNTWTKSHTSYALGFSSRMIERARDLTGLTAKERAAWGLVVASKQTAIDRWIIENNIGMNERRTTIGDNLAFTRGYVDGASISLDKRGMPS